VRHEASGSLLFFLLFVWLLLLGFLGFLIKGYVHESMQRLGVILHLKKHFFGVKNCNTIMLIVFYYYVALFSS
jgi:hypothetical protein